MKNRIVFIITLLILKSFIFSENQSVIELNIRAEADISSTPAISIYYAEKSINKNLEMENEAEYIRSLYILARAYYIIDDFYMTKTSILKALDFIDRTGYNYGNSEFYIFVVRYFLGRSDYKFLSEILDNEFLYEIISERAQVEFNIVQIYMNIYNDNVLDRELIEESRAICDSAGFIDLKAELNIVEGDFNITTNIPMAKDLYQQVLVMPDLLNKIEGLIRLGDLSSSLLYYEEAYLISESLRDYNISMDILEKLYGEYKRVEDYKNLTVVLEKIEYYKNTRNLFILNQYKELYNFGFQREHLTLQLESSQTQITLLKSVVIFMGMAILIFILFLSIQSYRLRGINI